MTTAANFHPMKGDVFEGNEVIFEDGRIYNIHDAGSGWTLRQGKEFVAGPFDAFSLTAYIVQHQ